MGIRLRVSARRDARRFALGKVPRFLMEAFHQYFRIDVEGLEHVPRRGRALVAPNHSGCSGLDAVMIGYILNRDTGRIPRILTLWTFFEVFRPLEGIALKLGLKEATAQTGLRLLRKNNLLVVFPEGEEGSFKPSSERYRLQPFRTGFVRMALLTDSPIVPALVIGAEESNINLGKIRLPRLKGLILPVPFNFLPLPAKWKIKFLPPLDLSGYGPEDVADRSRMLELAEKIRVQMQKALDQELAQRSYVYFGPPKGVRHLLVEGRVKKPA